MATLWPSGASSSMQWITLLVNFFAKGIASIMTHVKHGWNGPSNPVRLILIMVTF